MNPPLVRQRKTITFLRRAALTAYVVAILCFGAGMIWNEDEIRELGLAIGVVGLAFDVRFYTHAAIARLVHNMSLWQDGEESDGAHRAEVPPASA